MTCRNGHQAVTQNLGEKETESKKNVMGEWVGKENKKKREKYNLIIPTHNSILASTAPNTPLPRPHLLESNKGFVEHNDSTSV